MKGRGEKEARDSSRMRDVHGYWACSAYHFSGFQFCVFLRRLSTVGQKLGGFPYDFLNENPRHKPALRGSGATKPALLTRGSSRTPFGAVTLSLLGYKHQ